MGFCHLRKIQSGITSFQPTLDLMPMVQYLRNYMFYSYELWPHNPIDTIYKMMPTNYIYNISVLSTVL